jgi:hypothetical protein
MRKNWFRFLTVFTAFAMAMLPVTTSTTFAQGTTLPEAKLILGPYSTPSSFSAGSPIPITACLGSTCVPTTVSQALPSYTIEVKVVGDGVADAVFTPTDCPSPQFAAGKIVTIGTRNLSVSAIVYVLVTGPLPDGSTLNLGIGNPTTPVTITPNKSVTTGACIPLSVQ